MLIERRDRAPAGSVAALLLPALLPGCALDTSRGAAGVQHCDAGVAVAFAKDLVPAVDEWATDGGSGVLLVSADGCLAYQSAVGRADAGRAMSVGLYFDIGSLTKEFTAYAILKLAEDGGLSLDDTLGEWFAHAPADKRGITLRQLLTHSSGLADIVDEAGAPIAYVPELDFEPLSKQDLVTRTMRADLVGVPGKTVSYSNFGYSLLAAIIEDASKLPYTDYVHAAVLRPFGMRATGYPPRLVVEVSELAVGYVGERRWGTTYERLLPDGPGWMLIGSGGMIAPPGDLFRWVDGIATGLMSGDTVAKQFVELFHETTASGEKYIVSFGSNDVYEAGYLWMIDRGIVIVATTNNSGFTANGLVNAAWKAIRTGTSGSRIGPR